MTVDYKDLGNRIRKKREERHMSQADLAGKVHLSTQHVSNVENAKSKVGLDKLVAIANVLDCSLDELVCGSIKQSRTIYHDEISEMLEEFSEIGLRSAPEILKHINYVYKLMKKDAEREKEG